MKAVEVRFPKKEIKGEVRLPASKSISNRVLIIRALCETSFSIDNLSEAKDTVSLHQLLGDFAGGGTTYDVGPAGTSFRFLTAFLSIQEGVQVLTGSERMLLRPIGPLVDALRQIGAQIEYLGEDGYPPIKIGAWLPNEESVIQIPAHISSQFLSALLMIGPYLPKGLRLIPEGARVSSSYINMTIRLMQAFGAEVTVLKDSIQVARQAYRGQDFYVENDWSAASYFYGLAVGSKEAALFLPDLFQDSLQGDQSIIQLSEKFGVESTWVTGGISLRKRPSKMSPSTIDFTEFPDLAQTILVMCALTGREMTLTGLTTLRIKETDRINAMEKELGKVGIQLVVGRHDIVTIRGRARERSFVSFDTYEDHRMAMALSLFAIRFPIIIQEPSVIEKSFPRYWQVLQQLGAELSIQDDFD